MEAGRKPGKLYRDRVMKSPYPSVVSAVYAIRYLKPQEVKVWMELIALANMTRYGDGTFNAKVNAIAKATGTSVRTAKGILQDLSEIGLIRRHRPGRTYFYEIDFNALETLCHVIHENGMIGMELRKIRGNANVLFIRNSEVMKACRMAGVEFHECGLLKEKVWNTAPVNTQ